MMFLYRVCSEENDIYKEKPTMTLDNLFPIVLLITTLGAALMAGMFYTFSNFVMGALGRVEPTQGIASMQQINIVILNPLFFIIFMGTAIMSIALPASVLLGRTALSQESFLIAGSAFYLIGVMLVTIVRNVPMNNALEALEAHSDEAHQLWSRYLVDWTRWNHVRSVASLLSTLCFILAPMG
jgi:uncharacterized membrane protein